MILTIFFVGLMFHAPAQAVQSIDLFVEHGVDMGQSYGDGDLVMRSAPVVINPVLFEAVDAIEHGRSPSSVQLRMSFFFDPTIVVRLARWERISPTGLALIGTIEGTPGSEAILVIGETTVTANISLPGRLFHIRPGEDGGHTVQEIDYATYPEHLEPIPVLDVPAPSSPDPPMVNDGTQIDVLVAYTADARAAAGGPTQIETLIDLAAAETNQGYTNSGVTQRIRLVHKVETPYSEAGFDWSATLSRLQQTTDGYMDNIHTLRDTYGADLVVLIVNASDYCGLGYLMQTVSSSFAAYGFCLVSRICATGYYSFAHEMGHNMGAHHDRANASGSGAFPFSYGYQAPDRAFRTVMAYNCSGGCQRINHWSNPDVEYGGQPTGVLYTAPDSADNRRTLNNTVATVANFRTGGASLSVEKTGTGSGSVTSNPPGIDCGSTCSSTFSEGSTVTLTATALPGSSFDGWNGGACSGTGACVLIMNTDVQVTAAFSHQDVPPEPSIREGTIGTRITITGSGFGARKGKVLIGGVAAKIAKDGWSDSVIHCIVNKILPPGGSNDVTVMIQPYKTAPSVTIPDAFIMEAPEPDPLSSDHGLPGTELSITGKFFSTKKGKVYLVHPQTGAKRTCKVTYWYMNPTDGTSELTFVIPKGIAAGTSYSLQIVGKIGTATASANFTVDP